MVNKIWFFVFLSLVILSVSACAFNNTPSPSDVTETVSTTVATTPTTDNVTVVSPVSPVSPIEQPPPAEVEKPQPEELRTMFDESTRLYKIESYDLALDQVNQLLKISPRNALALNLRGNIYTSLERYEEAVKDYSDAIDLRPSFFAAYYNRGRVYDSLGQPEKAIADLQQAAQIDPVNFGYRALGNIGLVHYEQGNYNEAIEAFNESITYNSNNRADVYYYRAEAYSAVGDFQSAIDDYEAALTRYEQYSDAYRGLGYAYLQVGSPELALETLEQAQALAYNHPTNLLYLALIYLALDQTEEAQKFAEEGMTRVEVLEKAEQAQVLSRVTGTLEQLSKENPSKAENIEALLKIVKTR